MTRREYRRAPHQGYYSPGTEHHRGGDNNSTQFFRLGVYTNLGSGTMPSNTIHHRPYHKGGKQQYEICDLNIKINVKFYF